MMKPIKFDLTINNGDSLRTLHDLEKNLSPALLEHFYSGKLARWLQVRKLDELADKVEHLLTLEKSHQVQLFQNLCEVFISKISEEDARQAMQNYKPAIEVQISNHDEIEQLKFENQTLRVEIEKLKNQLVDRDVEETPNFELPNKSVSKDDRELLKLLETGNEQQRGEIASSPNLSIFLQHKLLDDSAESVVIALAKNEFLSDEIQEKLAIEGMPKIREALAENVKLNEKQQNYLFETGSREVKAVLATNPSLISAIKGIFLKVDDEMQTSLASNPSLSVDLQEIIVNSNNEIAKKILANNPSLDSKFFNQLLNNCDDEMLESLASHPSLPKNLLEKWEQAWLSLKPPITIGLARNPAISENMMEKYRPSTLMLFNDVRFVGSINEREIKSFASNPALPEQIQARLISDYDKLDRAARILAENPSLKPAQQAELANIGNADVRLNLLRNSSVKNSLKEKITQSFNHEDLNDVQNRFENEKNLAKRLSKEEQEAEKKYFSYNPSDFFSSYAENDRLRHKWEKAKKALENVVNEIAYLQSNIETLEQIL